MFSPVNYLIIIIPSPKSSFLLLDNETFELSLPESSIIIIELYVSL